jgi:deoxyribonuclease V
MDMSGLHRWDVSPAEAAEVQQELRRRLDLVWRNPPVNSVGGVDVRFRRGRALAAFIVLEYPTLTPLEAATAELPVAFPYIPGLLAFREGPVVLQAWERLRRKPDLIMFDAQGIAHPRGFGLASHMALWLERPGIRCGQIAAVRPAFDARPPAG